MDDRQPGFATRAVHAGVGDAEAALAAIEGGTAAVTTPTGVALLVAALQPLMQPGTQAVVAADLLAEFPAFGSAAAGFGWDIAPAGNDDPAAFEKAVTPRTQVFVASSLSPLGTMADLAALTSAAKRAQVPLLVDNTLATPALCQPVAFGADAVLHMDARLLAGEPRGVGFVVDAGRFNWRGSARYPALTAGRGEAGGPIADDVGNFAYASALRALSGEPAALDAILRAGLETLGLRMARHSEAALRLAQFLAGHGRVAAVSFPGVSGDRHHALARRYMPGGAGGTVWFALAGGQDAAVAFLASLTLIANAPVARAAMSHAAPLPPAVASSGGAHLRLAVGLEDVSDLIADLDQALAAT